MFVEIEKMRDESRIWVFQADRMLSSSESLSLSTKAQAFTQSWSAHDIALKASAAVIHGLFLIVAVDEADTDASGCSIDSMTRFVREAGQEFNINFFDRKRVAIDVDSGIELKLFSEAGEIARKQEDLKVYDSLVSTLGELRSEWKKEFNKSWHARLA